MSSEHEFEPDRVWLEVAEGEVAQAGVFRAADRVFDRGALALELFEPRDTTTCLVGDEDLETMPVMIGEGQLCAGVGGPVRLFVYAWR